MELTSAIIAIVTAILGSSALAAIITKIADKRQWERQRKAALEDKAEEKEDKAEEKEDKAEQKETEQNKAISELTQLVKDMHGSIDELSKAVDQMNRDQVVYYYDRVQFLAVAFIKDRKISLSNRDNLIKMHDVYHRRGGNGNLDSLMEKVKALPIIDCEVSA